MASTLSFAFLLLASQAQAFFRLPCANPVTVERLDSIVTPGALSGHVHTVMGSSGFGISSNYESLRDGECTSCYVHEDMSAYWVPQLYFQWKNGSFSPVQQSGGALIYYLPRKHESDTTGITAFPAGFQVLTGTPNIRSLESTSAHEADALGWNCLGSVSPTVHKNIPSVNCPNGLRQEVRFPSCWDGKNLDSADHFSHMSYGGGESGPCPATHPVRLVTIFYEIMWNVDEWNDLRSEAANPNQPFVLSNGDSTGYSSHADFQNGWDVPILQKAIDECTSDSGVIEECKVFTMGHTNCHKTRTVNEPVLTTLETLPGCNPVTDGPERATMCKESEAPELFPRAYEYKGQTPPPGAEVPSDVASLLISYENYDYVSCFSDSAPTRALPTRLDTATATVEACLDACKEGGFDLCGIEYNGRECWVGNTLPDSSKDLGFSSCGMPCIDDPSRICGGNSNGPAFVLYSNGKADVAPSTNNPGSTFKIQTVILADAGESAVVTTRAAIVATTTLNTQESQSSTTTSSESGSESGSDEYHYSDSDYNVVAINRVVRVAQAATTTPPSEDGDEEEMGGSKFTEYVYVTEYECDASSGSGGFTITTRAAIATSTSAAETNKDNAATTLVAGKGAMPTTGTGSNGNEKENNGGSATAPHHYGGENPTNVALSGKWEYESCYSDYPLNRALATLLSTNDATVESCLEACENAGFALCGVSFHGRECWGDNSLDNSSQKLQNEQCNFHCRGDPTRICGGDEGPTGHSLSLYKKQGTNLAQKVKVRRRSHSSHGKRHATSRL